MQPKSHFLIAATSSGSGKTTLSLGLLRALRNRMLKVQPFKCGPDYIDIKFHELASSLPAYNLDTFMASESHVQELYDRKSRDCDVCLTEGVMGLFDGYDRMQGSSAQIAALLRIPVVLVINAKSMAYSAAAMIYGFKNFDKRVNVVGVVFNFVASDSHYQFLKEACHDVGVEPLGYLPKNADITIPSRHLGLNIDKEFVFDEFAEKAASLCEKYINIDRLLEITKRDTIDADSTSAAVSLTSPDGTRLKIAVAKDDAFNFMYHENIDVLQTIGDVSFFSPIHDTTLPAADFVYLPGGYPELYLEPLSDNITMRQSIKSYVESGGRLLAECGGMMYLSAAIADAEGKEYPMVGVFEQQASMQHMKLKLGYRTFTYNGVDVLGHEFHYSTLNSCLPSVAQLNNAKGTQVDTKLLRYKNAIAGYTHIYWGDGMNILDLFFDRK